MNVPTPEGCVRLQLDANTVVFVREGVNVEEVKEKFANRNAKRGDYAYLFDYGNHNTYKTKRGRIEY
jgi:hypothetical protein